MRFLKFFAAAVMCTALFASCAEAQKNRAGDKPVVYMTKEITPEALVRI